MNMHPMTVLVQALLLQSLWIDGVIAQQSGSATCSPYAATLDAIEKAKTVTYTVTAYSQVPGKEGQDPQYQPMFRAKTEHQFPNLYRETRYDREGNVHLVEIVDTSGKKKSLMLDMKNKQATWRDSPINVYGPGSPLEMLANLVRKMPEKPVGQRDVGGCKADVFRVNGMDIWLDTKSKRLVGISIPGVDRFNPSPADVDKAVGRPGRGRSAGQIRSDIIYGAALDKALFNMTPPEGFTVAEAEPLPTLP